jgi:hypothetical protein
MEERFVGAMATFSVPLGRGKAARAATGTERELETNRQDWKPLCSQHSFQVAKERAISTE